MHSLRSNKEIIKHPQQGQEGYGRNWRKICDVYAQASEMIRLCMNVIPDAR